MIWLINSKSEGFEKFKTVNLSYFGKSNFLTFSSFNQELEEINYVNRLSKYL